MQQSALCARCGNEDCSSIVVIPAIPDEDKKLDPDKKVLHVTCPSCRRPFSTPFHEMMYYDVTDEDLGRRFIVIS